MSRAAPQVAIESGQVLAGVVGGYPADNPFYAYHVQAWSLVNQLAAAGLALGMTEGALTVMANALIGALALTALGLFALAVSGDRWLAVAAAVWIVAFGCWNTWGTATR